MRYFFKFTILLSLFGIICLACAKQSSSEQSSHQRKLVDVTQNDNSKGAKCTSDLDCVLVKAGCCPCSGGGKMIAVHLSLVENHLRKVQNQCPKSFACAQVYLCENYKAECVNSVCKTIDNVNAVGN